MADTSSLDGLLDRAGHAFSLAFQLGYTFQKEREYQRNIGRVDPASWSRHEPSFNEYCDAVLGLRDAMENPPKGFDVVANALLKAAGVARDIRNMMETSQGRTWAGFLDFFPNLNSIAAAGHEAIQVVTKAHRLDDPFAFVDDAMAKKSPRFGSIPNIQEKQIPNYKPSTELGRIVCRLNDPSFDLATSPDEEVVLSPLDVERRRWLPILKDHIARIPELAENLTEETLRRWLWEKHKVPPTRDLFADELVPFLEYEPRADPFDQSNRSDTPQGDGIAKVPRKRSTEKGEARAKLISALTVHHRYADGGCLHLDPIGNNELAELAEVSISTASEFFRSEFGGHGKYRVVCMDSGRLADSLKVLNGEFSPQDLYSRRPVGEDNRGDDDDE